MAALDIATLVIYAIFVQPTIYIIWRHGKRGILGWFYAHAFCILRIVGSILDIVQGSSSSTSFSVLIVSNIGLSPLLLASLGVLHEASVQDLPVFILKSSVLCLTFKYRRQARYANLRNRLEWFLIIQYHCVISAAMALIIVGITRLENGQDAEATKSIFLKIGMTIVVLCWLVLLVWGLISLPRPKDIKIATYSNGSIVRACLTSDNLAQTDRFS